MADDAATREATINGDLDAWGPFEQAHNHMAIGALSRSLYIDGADLKLSAGFCGLYNGSQYYSITNAAARVLSVAGLTASCWASVELSITLGAVTTTIASIGGATSPATLPASFTGAYDGSKGGHYITATKRCIALIWINAAGACEGIVNAIGSKDAYEGYSTSDDTVDIVYYFGKNIQARKPAKIVKTLTGSVTLPDLQEDTELVLNIPGGYTATLPTLADNIGRVITIQKTDDNQWWGDVDGEGAETINGDLHYYLRRQYDYITVMGMATEWRIIANGAPKILRSGVINRTDWTNVHNGTVNLVHTDALGGTLTATNIIGKKVTGGTTGSYGWVTGYVAGTKTIYLRNVTSLDATHVFDSGENLVVSDVNATTLDTLSNAAANWINTDSVFYHGFGCTSDRLSTQLIYYDGVTYNQINLAHIYQADQRGTILVPVDAVSVIYHTAQGGAAIMMDAAGGANYLDSDAGTYEIIVSMV